MFALFEKSGTYWKRMSDKTWETREEAQRAADHLNMVRRGTEYGIMEVAVWDTEKEKM